MRTSTSPPISDLVATVPAALEPLVVDLADRRARDAGLVGAKAANLARAHAAGLAVLPGIVLTTAATGRWSPGEPPTRAALEALRAPVEALAQHHNGALVVRSSSTIEDAHHSSMATVSIHPVDRDRRRPHPARPRRRAPGFGRPRPGSPDRCRPRAIQRILDNILDNTPQRLTTWHHHHPRHHAWRHQPPVAGL